MSRAATGAQRRAGTETSSAPSSRSCVSLSRWAHPRLLETVSRVLTYEPLHPLNVFAQHFYYAQILLSLPVNGSLSGGSPSSSQSPASQPHPHQQHAVAPLGVSEDPLRCFTAASFLREWLAPYGVEALRTAMLPGWCGVPNTIATAPLVSSQDADGMDLATKQHVLHTQHSTVIALLHCQDRATQSEKEFAAVSEASNQNPMVPLFFSEENEVAAATAAAFCAAWIEQELQLEIPSAITPAVALALTLVTLVQLHERISRQCLGTSTTMHAHEAVEVPLQTATTAPTVPSHGSPSPSTSPSTVCAWVAAVSPAQAAQLYAYLYCRLTEREALARAPCASGCRNSTPPYAQDALNHLVNMIDFVTTSFSRTYCDVDQPAVDPAALRHALSCGTLLLSSIVHVAVPLCQWLSGDAEGDGVGTTDCESYADPFLRDVLPELATAVHAIVMTPDPAETPKPRLSGSMAGFDLSVCLPHLKVLSGFAAPRSAAREAEIAADEAGSPLSPSLDGLLSYAAQSATTATLPSSSVSRRKQKKNLAIEATWQWTCLCLAAVWEDVFAASHDSFECLSPEKKK